MGINAVSCGIVPSFSESTQVETVSLKEEHSKTRSRNDRIRRSSDALVVVRSSILLCVYIRFSFSNGKQNKVSMLSTSHHIFMFSITSNDLCLKV